MDLQIRRHADSSLAVTLSFCRLSGARSARYPVAAGVAAAAADEGRHPPFPRGGVPRIPGEIRSAEGAAISSLELRELREVLGQARIEARRLRSEMQAARYELHQAQTLAYGWQQGRLLKRLLRRRYATILEEYDAARTNFRFLEKAMEQSYAVLVDAFRALAACQACWDTTSAVAVDRARERSNATRSITLKRVVLDCRPAPMMDPSLPALRLPNANGGDLYFLPGLLLV
jgi:hypothetical protein